jgi:hypothetical protein
MVRDTIEIREDTEVAIAPTKQLAGGGVRLEIDVVDGPRWRLDVNRRGTDYEVVTAWNAADELADVEPSDWMDDLLLRLQA